MLNKIGQDFFDRQYKQHILNWWEYIYRETIYQVLFICITLVTLLYFYSPIYLASLSWIYESWDR